MSDRQDPPGDTESYGAPRRRWQWPVVVGCIALAATLLLQAGAVFAVVMMLPDQGDGWRTAAREAISPAVRNAGLFVGILAAAAIVGFTAWLLAWGIREVVNGFRPRGGSSGDSADTDEAPS